VSCDAGEELLDVMGEAMRREDVMWYAL